MDATVRALRRPEVLARTGLSLSQLNRLEATDQFPKRFPLGPRTVAWLSTEITRWVLDRAAAREMGKVIAA